MDHARFEANKALIAVQLLSLQEFTDEELRVFYLALRLHGKVLPRHLCFQKALDTMLIKENGQPGFDDDLCLYAIETEITLRRERGEFR